MNNSDQSNNFASENIIARFLKGIGANSLGVVLNFITKIVLVPLFLKTWGVTVYGEWLLISSFVAYLSLMDLGGQLYIINRLTQAYARSDIPLLRKTLHSGLALFVALPGAVYLFFISILLVFRPTSLFSIQVTSQNITMLTLGILAFQFTFSLPYGILLGLYRSVGLLPRGVMLGNIMTTLQIVFISVGLKIGMGLPGIATLQVIPYIPVTIFAIWELDKRFPEFKLLSLQFVSLSTVKSFIKPSLNFFLIKMSKTLSLQGVVLIVGIIFTPVQVVIFSTIRTLANILSQATGLITNSAWPEMTRLDAEHNDAHTTILFRFILRTTLLALVILIVIFYFLGEPIYKFWLQNEVEYHQDIMNLFLIYLFQLSFWTACSQLLMATNRHHGFAKLTFTASFLSISLSYLLGLKYGLQGIILGMIVADLLLPFWGVPFLLKRHYRQFTAYFFFQELLPVIVAALFMINIPILSPIIFVILLVWWISVLRQTRSLSNMGKFL